MTKEYSIRTQDYPNSHIEETVLDPNDPIQDMKRLAGLTPGLNVGALQEYKGEGSVQTDGSNPSITANEKIQYQHENDIKPGTPEWFRLWFSLPYLTGEKPW